ncbi:Pc17g00660 [Penicillium rubens Wisconsin 54-1255]|uniref:Pc17g00660 protein n=1 Tax=Penicillium rubens (strain ATCC 28089 / DSM 1075 / NRRL 1951 / Wisconsin 54-1255) TaxID=500485 RepID=B6HAY9_PENRW|nr:Pc17g00660 [Penicillium rubens Wisconsin 54-1255]
MEKRRFSGSISQSNCLRLKASRQSAIVQHEAQVAPSRRPVACFYIRFPDNYFHHVIYIPERTICELRDQIMRKVQVRTRTIFHRNGAGPNILVDNEFVRQFPDRQVMIAEFLDTVNIDRDIDVTLKYQGIRHLS